MRYIELKEHFKDFILFSLQDIRKFDLYFHRRRLSEWKEKGYIKPIVNGSYIFADQEPDENRLFFIANRIYRPSYISLEAALAYYGFIPEAVFSTTSVSTRKTKTFATFYGKMIYRHIHPRCFFGYRLVEFGDFRFKIATPEKAVLDFLYLNPRLKRREDIEELRFNREEVREKVDKDRFTKLSHRFNQQSLRKRAKLWIEVIYHA